MNKEERKTEQNYIKNGEKGLKNAYDWIIYSRFFQGGLRSDLDPDKTLTKAFFSPPPFISLYFCLSDDLVNIILSIPV